MCAAIRAQCPERKDYMAEYFVGQKEYFPGIGKIHYEGPKSDNPLAFKFYDPDRKVGNTTMREHLRFAIAYWHSFGQDGTDPLVKRLISIHGRLMRVRLWKRMSTSLMLPLNFLPR